jgi:hypothetical protein
VTAVVHTWRCERGHDTTIVGREAPSTDPKVLRAEHAAVQALTHGCDATHEGKRCGLPIKYVRSGPP